MNLISTKNRLNRLFSVFLFLGALELIVCHKCNHDPSDTEIIVSPDGYEQVGSHDKNASYQKRLLFQEYYQPIRITTDTTGLSALTLGQKNSVLQLISATAQFFADTISVKRRNSNLYFPWSSSGAMCSDVTVSSTDTDTGILDSDLHIYFTSVTDSLSSYVGNAVACVVQSRDNRPIFGRFRLNLAKYSLASNSAAFNKNLNIFIHEYMHILGFSSSLYKYWKDVNGDPQDPSLFTSGYFFQGLNSIIRTPNLLNTAITYFNCTYLEGVPLENAGDSNSIGSHFEKLAFFNDIMTADVQGKQIFSLFDIALLQDTGWYQTNSAQAITSVWGAGKGCDFLKQACSSTQAFSEFCTVSNTKGCDILQLGRATCSLDSYTSTCMEQIVNADCTDGTLTPPSFTGENMNIQSRCFPSSLIATGQPTKSIDAGCYTTNCIITTSPVSITISVTVGGITQTCTTPSQQLTFTGYSGVIVCPTNFSAFCSNNISSCPDCTYSGYCNSSGTCSCVNGYFGTNCQCKGSDSTILTSGTPVYNSGTCFPLINKNCLTPNSGATLCPTSCVNGYYLAVTQPSSTVAQTCQPCPIGCATCTETSGAVVCLTCALNYYLNNATPKRCVLTCPSQFYGDDSTRTCLPCISLCQKCTDGVTCLQCLQYDGSGTGVCSAPLIVGSINVTCASKTSTQYITDIFQCYSCSALCTSPYQISCFGSIAPSQCSIYTGTCLSTQVAVPTIIAPGASPPTTFSCQAKQSPCSFPITSVGDKSCCPSNYYQVSPNECRQFDSTMIQQIVYIQQYTQVTQCNSNYYSIYPTEYQLLSLRIYYCLRCDSTCATCTDSLPTSCTLCAPGYYMYRSLCISTCPYNTYADYSRVCLPCNVSCSGCTGGTNQNCINCAIYYKSNSNACLPTCGYGQYVDSLNACQPCLTNCQECLNSTSCVQCQAGNYWFLQTQQCVSTIQVGFYLNSATGQILQCDSSCYSCNGGTSSSCLTCPSGQNFNYGKCVSACDPNQILVTSVNSSGVSVTSCVYCHYSCATCTGVDQYSCTSCNNFFYRLSTSPMQCVQFCPNNYYLVLVSSSPNIYSCQLCQCETCDSNGNCILCPLGKYYDFTLPSTNPCVTTCTASGTYQDDLNRTCSTCSAHCLQCDNDTQNGCKVCDTGYSLALGNQCIPTTTCGTAQFYDGLQCLSCISNCSVCYTADTCSFCNTGYQYSISLQSCVLESSLTCPDGQYFDSYLLKACTACPDYCLKCTSETVCTVYKTLCHYTCSDCVGTTDNTCTTCPSTRQLQKYFVNSNVGQCQCLYNYSDFGDSTCKQSKSGQIQYSATGVDLILQSILTSVLSFVSSQSFYFRIGADFSQYFGQFSYLKRHNLVGFDKTLGTFRYYNFNLLLQPNFDSPNYQSSRILDQIYSTTSNRSRFISKIEQIHDSSSFFTSCFSTIILIVVTLIIMTASRYFKTSADGMPDILQAEQQTKWSFISYFQLLIPSYVFAFTVQELSLCIFMQFNSFDTSINSEFQGVGLAFAILFFLFMVAVIGLQLLWLPRQKEENSLMILTYYQLLNKKQSRFAARYDGIVNLKKVFYSFLLVVAYSQPLVPIAFMFFGEIIFTLSVAILQPYKDKELNILTIIMEAFVIVITLIMFVMVGQPSDSSAQVNGVFAIVVISNSLIILFCLFSIYMIITRSREISLFKRIFPEQNTMIPHQAVVDQSMTVIEQEEPLKNHTNFISYTNNNMATQMPQYTDIQEPKAVQEYQSRKKMLSNVNRKKLINYDGIQKEHEQNIQNQQKALLELQQRGKLYQQQQLIQKQQYLQSQISTNRNQQSLQQETNSIMQSQAQNESVQQGNQDKDKNKQQSNKFFQKSKNANKE